MQYVGLCVFSLPISLLVIMIICALYVTIIIKSEVWITSHCLWLRHEAMLGTVCFTMFLQYIFNMKRLLRYFELRWIYWIKKKFTFDYVHLVNEGTWISRLLHSVIFKINWHITNIKFRSFTVITSSEKRWDLYCYRLVSCFLKYCMPRSIG